jgi:hypothetical protein
MREAYENITPKLAERMLNANTNNRPLKQGHCERLATDMRDGAWTHCLAPIAFYDDNSLADGQHRLWAIIESGTTQRFRVVRDLPKDAGINIDTGVARTVVDVAHIQGLDTTMSIAVAAICRGIEDGQPNQGKRGRTMSQTLAIVAKHGHAAHWVASHGPNGRGVRNSAVMAAIGRAYYVESDKDRLAKFSKVLTTGLIESMDDSSAVAMRNYLLQRVQQGLAASHSKQWRDIFLKTQSTIHAFMRRKPLKRIVVQSDETYPPILAPEPTTAPAKAPTTRRGKRRAVTVKLVAKRRKK